MSRPPPLERHQDPPRRPALPLARAWAPGNGSSRDDAFRTHEEAVAYATAQARRTQLAAIQGATP